MDIFHVYNGVKILSAEQLLQAENFHNEIPRLPECNPGGDQLPADFLVFASVNTITDKKNWLILVVIRHSRTTNKKIEKKLFILSLFEGNFSLKNRFSCIYAGRGGRIQEKQIPHHLSWQWNNTIDEHMMNTENRKIYLLPENCLEIFPLSAKQYPSRRTRREKNRRTRREGRGDKKRLPEIRKHVIFENLS